MDESPIDIENADELRVFGIGKNDIDHAQDPEEILVRERLLLSVDPVFDQQKETIDDLCVCAAVADEEPVE